MISAGGNLRLVTCLHMDSHMGPQTNLIQSVLVDVSIAISIVNLFHAAIVTSQWKTHKQQAAKTSNDVDYRRLNKLASKNRVTTAKDSYAFRQGARKHIALPDVSKKTFHVRKTS